MAERFPAELIKGTTELLVLSLLSRGEPLHGYGILKRLRELSDDRFRMNEGALYPLLHRLVREKKVKAATTMVGGRERKSYRLTAAGGKALARARSVQEDYQRFVARVLQEPEASPRSEGDHR